MSINTSLQDLSNKISAINPEAGAYILSKELHENPTFSKPKFEPALLICLMDWGTTPQGSDYWGEICNSLKELDD